MALVAEVVVVVSFASTVCRLHRLEWWKPSQGINGERLCPRQSGPKFKLLLTLYDTIRSDAAISMSKLTNHPTTLTTL